VEVKNGGMERYMPLNQPPQRLEVVPGRGKRIGDKIWRTSNLYFHRCKLIIFMRYELKELVTCSYPTRHINI
jgi:hypothetical protein